MPFPSELKENLDLAGKTLQQTFLGQGTQAAGQATPEQLMEAIHQFIYVFDKIDMEHGERGAILYDDVSQLGDYAIGCLIDLAFWADRLALPKQKLDFERVALGVAHWAVRHEGEIRTIEPLVNALAASANSTESKDALKALLPIMQNIIEHASLTLKNDLEKNDPTRAWRILNLNYAIVATRTQEPALMRKAYDTLEINLPEDCPSFFEEGLKQAEKAVYGPDVKAMMKDYFSKWTTRH